MAELVMMQVLAVNDWLGTSPIFYHEKTGRYSADISEVIDLPNLEFDPDGLRDYLDFGYCVFGHTPIRHVRFLPPATQLYSTTHGAVAEARLPDPVEGIAYRETNEIDVIEQLRSAVQAWEARVESPIVLPLSGGFDSRMLACFLRRPSQANAFTYGISDDPERSTETITAREVAQQLGIRWEHIRLGDFHLEMGAWDALFGPSCHCHGMYHLEFYRKIRSRYPTLKPLLSGVVGDAWAGSIGFKRAESPQDLNALGYTHGSDAAGLRLRLRAVGHWKEKYWAEHRAGFQDPKRQCIEIIRLKMMLLRYLLRVPSALGFEAWSPFVDCSLATAMVCLPPERRRNRVWQHSFFSERKMAFPTIRGSRQNSLDFRATLRVPPPPLSPTRLRELFDPADIRAINEVVCSPTFAVRFRAWIYTYPRGARWAGLLRADNPFPRCYATYMVLRPLDNLIARRDAARAA